MRILLFEDEVSIRKPISRFLQGKGHEVLDFPSPRTCALVSDKDCRCPRGHACADMIITDMKMPKMTGLELIRVMAEKGCRLPSRNKIVISSFLTADQQAECRALGCHFLSKPFQLDELWKVVQACDENISPHRKLTLIEELWKTIRDDDMEANYLRRR